jgi:hypothetical protein
MFVVLSKGLTKPAKPDVSDKTYAAENKCVQVN